MQFLVGQIQREEHAKSMWIATGAPVKVSMDQDGSSIKERDTKTLPASVVGTTLHFRPAVVVAPMLKERLVQKCFQAG